jgi:hypothetical protein
LTFIALFISFKPVSAQTTNPTVWTIMPRDSAPASPHSVVADNHQIYNDLIVPSLPVQSRQADIADDGTRQPDPGHGISSEPVGIGQGLNLYRHAEVCNDFNQRNEWASQDSLSRDLLSDGYAGWGAFAVDDGNFYRAANVVFTLERVVGPGNKYGNDQFSIKIASNQPYAAGLGSPIIAAPAGAEIVVTVSYMIFDHDTLGQDYDWVSLGLKPDATGATAIYVNGYTRGRWTEISHAITTGETGEIMILLQGHSPAALNSNIYFDDVRIQVDGAYVKNCRYE